MPALADKARWEGLMAEQGLASTFTQTEGLAPALPGTATYGNVRVDLNNERLRELIRTEISQMPANADEVWPGVWVGNGKAAQDLQFLLGLGITAVVNMAEGDRTCPVLVDTKLYNKHSLYTIFLNLFIGTGSLLMLTLHYCRDRLPRREDQRRGQF